jgi:hypothetical protein
MPKAKKNKKKKRATPRAATSPAVLQPPAQEAPAAHVLSSVPPVVLSEATTPRTLKLDLGCGQNPKDGFEGVDVVAGAAKHVVDLFKFPWPFADNSVDEIYSAHFLEHIPAREVEARDLSSTNPDASKFLGQDMLFAFMDECYRIMKVDAWMEVIVPSGRSSRAFWDPTHRRFFMQETFLYFSAEWRKINKLDHYKANCNFGVDVGATMSNEEALRAQEVQQTRMMHYWNVAVDWVARMKKLSPL